MHLRILTIGVTATFCITAVFWPKTASAAEVDDPQDVLVECPNWHWVASEVPGVSYELCFDDIDHCTAASIGDQVCIPSLGRHDVWVTAIDDQGADPVYYDSEFASINRIRSADINGNGRISFLDLLDVISVLGETGDYAQDLNADGMVSNFDIFIVIENFGRCIGSGGSLYEAC